MEDLMNFFQGSLEKDFGYSDDQVIESLRNCMEELRRARLDLPPAPTDDSEFPSKPFGVFVTPTIDQIIGRQSMMIDGEVVDNGAMVIPADGGPVVVPMQSLMNVNHHPSSMTSSSVLDHYDTATDGLSSRRISVRDGRSSITSLVDEFLDIEDDIGDVTAEGNDLHVDHIEVNDDLADTQQWPWTSSSMPFISSPGPTSQMSPTPAARTPPSLSPMSDTACITVDRHTVGMVSLNQPVSLVTIVTDDGKSSTPPVSQHLPPRQFQRTVRGIETDAGVRDFFAPTCEPWSQYVRSSPYPSFAGHHPTNTTYHLHALKSAKVLSRQRYFSSGRVDGSSDASHRSRPNGFSMQVAQHSQPGAVSAPAIGSGWPESNGWPLSSTSDPANMDIVSNEQPVINVRSKVVSPSGNRVGSKVIFLDRNVSQRPPYMSSVQNPANWVYRL